MLDNLSKPSEMALLTIKEAAMLTGMSDITMRRWIAKDLLLKSPEVVSIVRQSDNPRSPFVYRVSQALVEQTFAAEIKRQATQKIDKPHDKPVDGSTDEATRKPRHEDTPTGGLNREVVLLESIIQGLRADKALLQKQVSEKDQVIQSVIQMGFRLNAPKGDTINQENQEHETDNQEPQAQT